MAVLLGDFLGCRQLGHLQLNSLMEDYAQNLCKLRCSNDIMSVVMACCSISFYILVFQYSLLSIVSNQYHVEIRCPWAHLFSKKRASMI